LQSGDQVEIITSKAQHVQPSWINFVSTAKAKGKILAILRRDSRELQKQGEELFTEFLKKNNIDDIPNAADLLTEYHDIRSREEFFQAIGEKSILLGDKDVDELLGKNTGDKRGWRKFVPFLKQQQQKKAVEEQPELFVVPEKFNKKKPIYITDDNINQYKFNYCCHPIPGDDILGFIDGKHQIEIHKRACPVAAKLKASYGNRILDAKWDMHKKLFFDATIRLQGIDRVGMLLDISQVISSQMNVNIHKLTIASEEGVFDGTIELRVHDREDVGNIIGQLKKIPDVQDVTQIM
jgi:GTP pyrophosphokinase